MHDLSNESPWAASMAVGYSHKREPLAMVVIKAAYAIDIETGALTPLKKKPDIETADQHEGEPLKSALIATGECSPPKVGGEFYILDATLTLPNGETPAAEANVAITFSNAHANGHRQTKPFNKTIRAVGKRQWQGSWVLPSMSKPEPLKPISLTYENAYGGTDPDAAADPKEKHPSYLANYAGRGYVADAKRCTGIELPQLETAPFINSPADRPTPAGFGPLPVFWAPRRTEQGTADIEAAKRGGCPYGADAKATLHNVAPLDQRFPTPWQGGEIVTLTNILTGVQYGKAVNITLPNITPQIDLIEKGDTKALTAVFDTFWIDAKKNQLYLIYRAAKPNRVAKTEAGWIIVRDAQAPLNTEQQEAA